MNKTKTLIPDIFGELLGEICSHTPLAKERPLRWTVIANPTAGGFTIRSRWKRHAAFLEQCAALAARNPLYACSAPSAASGSRGLIPTSGAGHAGAITRTLVEEARSGASAGGLYLIITAGGDGTSLEVLTALYHAPREIRETFAVLRLPMGTGNDGADGPELEPALKLLIHPAIITRQRALRLSTANPEKTGFLAFNILSLGLDAFVTHMTNRMKGRLPGDSYKLWVDIASLLYDRLYRVGPMEVRALDHRGREVETFREKVLLLAVGESGYRTYGSHKRILPDSRNVCMVRQMPLLRKVALKDLFTTGGHINKPESLLFSASRVEIKGENPILAQMDGETVLLHPGDFPVAIELTEPLIPILKPLQGDNSP
jgi:diacylglycerol kinase family enzyme